MSDRRRSNFDVPDQTDAPVVWDPQSRSFVPVEAEVAPARKTSDRQWVVGADAVGKAPPPRPGTPPAGPPAAPPTAREGARTAAYTAAASAAPPAPPAPPHVAVPASPPGAPPPGGAPPVGPGRRRRKPKRLRYVPRARWIIAFLLLVPLVLGIFGWVFANRTFSRIQRVQVSSVLDPVTGGGTNYLIVGSDSRDAVSDAGDTDPNVQPAGEGVGNQRSDTMIVLRVDGTGTHLLSLPRDLCLDPCQGASSRLNAAFNDGPASLIQAIQSSLDIPINRYMEVDFVTFSSLVDALGGVTIHFQHGAIDEHSGLFVDEVKGPDGFDATLDGRTALAYVRSRHYEDIIDGERHPEAVPFPDVARGLRQQAFLRAVFAKLSGARNPFTLARSASAIADGLRIDDAWSLSDAIKFAWHMRGSPPVSVDLTNALTPDTVHGASILEFNDNADAILAQFR